MAKKIKLSVCLATFNEEKNIKDCLESVKDLADEVIVVDGSSNDKTREIIRKIGAKVYKVKNQKMFHINKQKALDLCTGDWILQLDADERVTKTLREEILETLNCQIVKLSNCQINGYFIPRKNFFLTRFLTKGGQYPDYVIRLVKKGKAKVPCKSVHEQIDVEGEVGYLKNSLIHWAYPDMSSYIKRANRYTSLTAQDFLEEKISLSLISQLKYLILLPLITFIKIFFRHKGFLDGFAGFLFALFSGLHYPIAFIKYWELTKVKK